MAAKLAAFVALLAAAVCGAAADNDKGCSSNCTFLYASWPAIGGLIHLAGGEIQHPLSDFDVAWEAYKGDLLAAVVAVVKLRKSTLEVADVKGLMAPVMGIVMEGYPYASPIPDAYIVAIFDKLTAYVGIFDIAWLPGVSRTRVLGALSSIHVAITQSLVQTNSQMYWTMQLGTTQAPWLAGDPSAQPGNKDIVLVTRATVALMSVVESAITRADTQFPKAELLLATEYVFAALRDWGSMITLKRVQVRNFFAMVSLMVLPMQPADRRSLYSFVLAAVEGAVWDVVATQNARLEAFICKQAECIGSRAKSISAVRGSAPTTCDPKLVELIDAFNQAIRKRKGDSTAPFPDSVVQSFAALVRGIAVSAVAEAAGAGIIIQTAHASKTVLAVLGKVVERIYEPSFVWLYSTFNWGLNAPLGIWN